MAQGCRGIVRLTYKGKTVDTLRISRPLAKKTDFKLVIPGERIKPEKAQKACLVHSSGSRNCKFSVRGFKWEIKAPKAETMYAENILKVTPSFRVLEQMGRGKWWNIHGDYVAASFECAPKSLCILDAGYFDAKPLYPKKWRTSSLWLGSRGAPGGSNPGRLELGVYDVTIGFYGPLYSILDGPVVSTTMRVTVLPNTLRDETMLAPGRYTWDSTGFIGQGCAVTVSGPTRTGGSRTFHPGKKGIEIVETDVEVTFRGCASGPKRVA